MVKVAIIEDDKLSATALSEILIKYGEENNVKFSSDIFSNANSFFDPYKDIYDIVFIDIEMPGMDGIAAAKELRDLNGDVIIIFVTNVAGMAVNGYSVSALDYLIKPLKYPGFCMTLNEAIRLIERKRGIDVSVNTSSGIIYLNSSQILYVDVCYHKVVFHTDNGNIISWGNLKEIEKKLSGIGFLRFCSKCIINLKFVKNITESEIELGEEKIKINRIKYKIIMKQLSGFY